MPFQVPLYHPWLLLYKFTSTLTQTSLNCLTELKTHVFWKGCQCQCGSWEVTALPETREQGRHSLGLLLGEKQSCHWCVKSSQPTPLLLHHFPTSAESCSGDSGTYLLWPLHSLSYLMSHENFLLYLDHVNGGKIHQTSPHSKVKE